MRNALSFRILRDDDECIQVRRPDPAGHGEPLEGADAKVCGCLSRGAGDGRRADLAAKEILIGSEFREPGEIVHAARRHVAGDLGEENGHQQPSPAAILSAAAITSSASRSVIMGKMGSERMRA